MIGKNAGRQASSSGSTLVESTPMIRPEAVPPKPKPERATQPGHNEQQTNEVEDRPEDQGRPEPKRDNRPGDQERPEPIM